MGYGNPYGAVPQALENTRRTLRDVMADTMDQRREESKLRLALAGVAASTELTKLDHSRKLADIEFRNKEAGLTREHQGKVLQHQADTLKEAGRHNTAMEVIQGREVGIAESREQRLAREANREHALLGADDAISQLGMSPLAARYVRTLIPKGTKLPLKAYKAHMQTSMEQPGVRNALIMASMHDMAAQLLDGEPTPEKMAQLEKINKDMQRMSTMMEAEAWTPKVAGQVADDAQGAWEDFKDDSSAKPQLEQMLEQYGGDMTAARESFVTQYVKTAKQNIMAGPIADQMAAVRDGFTRLQSDLAPKPPEGLNTAVVAEIDRIAGKDGPEAAGKFKKEMEALFEKGDFAGMQKRLDRAAVPDEKDQKPEARSQKPEGKPGEAMAADGPPEKSKPKKVMTTKQLREFFNSEASRQSPLFRNISTWRDARDKKDRKLKGSFLRKPPM